MREAQHRIVAAIFIVGLPHHDGGVLAIPLRQCGDDPRAFDPVAFVAEAIVPPRAEAARAALLIDRNHVGHLVDQPLGRGRGGCAEDHLQAGGMEGFDRPVEPAPVVLSGLGLDPAPREFADPHKAEAHRSHSLRILGPYRFGPMFGIVAAAEFHGATFSSAISHAVSGWVRGSARPWPISAAPDRIMPLCHCPGSAR